MVTPNKELKNGNIKLSIQVSLNGLSFCALSSEEKKILFFKEIAFSKKLNPIELLKQIEEVYEQEPFLKEQNPVVSIIFLNELYSLVPEKFFQEESASDYLKFNTKILENDFVAQDHLQDLEMVNVYIPYTNVINFFFDRYGEFEYRHNMSILVENFLKASDQNEEVKIYLHCYTGGYDLIVINKGDLLLANSFKSKTKEDFIYYLLFTIEQLKLDVESLQLILLGKIGEHSDYYNMAYTYIRNISFLETSFGYIFAGKDEPPKASQHFPLLASLS